MPTRAPRIEVPTACAALLIGLAGCAGTPPRPYDAPPPYRSTRLDPQAAIELAVLPPASVPNFSPADGRLLVEHAYDELMEKGYTPLHPGHVESRLAEILPAARERGTGPAPLGALKGVLPADAYLEIDVASVKVVPGIRPAVYRIDTTATLVDGQDGETLFQQHLPLTYEVEYAADRTLPRGTLDELLRRHVARLLAGLPARRT